MNQQLDQSLNEWRDQDVVRSRFPPLQYLELVVVVVETQCSWVQDHSLNFSGAHSRYR